MIFPRIKDLPPEEQRPFEEWLVGKTRPVIEELPYEEQDAYYRHDYILWNHGRR